MTLKRPLTSILYVEDEPDIRAIAELALQDMGGFTLTSCASGAEALTAAQQGAPDLLLDVMMPDMDGFTTLRRLRELPAMTAVPAVFMTASANHLDAQACQALGVVDTIQKPFDPLSLAEHINTIWQQL
jgi:CheY-like chemotaxis protein